MIPCIELHEKAGEYSHLSRNSMPWV